MHPITANKPNTKPIKTQNITIVSVLQIIDYKNGDALFCNYFDIKKTEFGVVVVVGDVVVGVVVGDVVVGVVFGVGAVV